MGRAAVDCVQNTGLPKGFSSSPWQACTHVQLCLLPPTCRIRQSIRILAEYAVQNKSQQIGPDECFRALEDFDFILAESIRCVDRGIATGMGWTTLCSVVRL